jgi:photosystem II stability/assembly factor-like uncharacterized protein
MRKFILICSLLTSILEIRSQFYTSEFYKNRSEKVSLRNEWLFQQRLYPYVRSTDLKESHDQRDLLRRSGLTDNTSSWVSVGPSPAKFNFNDAGSRVRVIAYDPDSTNTIYIGSSNGGVWKTTNSGRDWVQKTDFEVSLSSGALAVYNDWSTNPPKRIVYYGTGEGGFGFVYSYYGRGLLKSTDGGDTWRQITNGLPATTYFYKIAVNPASPNVLLAALGSNYANPVNTGGLYRSEDFGESWTRIVPTSIGEEGLNCSDIVFSPDGNKAYILGPFTTGSPNWWENGTGYRISYDGGRTFTQVTTNLPGTGCLAIHPLSPDIMYAFTAVDCGTSQLYRSADAGLSWSWINSSFTSNQCGYNMALEMHPANAQNIYVGTIILYRSTNSGNVFQHESMPYHFDIHDIAFNPKNPNENIVATDGGVARSIDNGMNYTNINKTLTTLECYSVSSSSDESNSMITGSQDNGIQERYMSVSGNYEWQGLTGYDATTVVIDEGDPNRYIAQLSGSPVGIHVSSNRGNIWFVAAGLPQEYQYAWVRPIINVPSMPGRYYTASGSDIYLSDDYGLNWRAVNNNIDEEIQELAVCPTNPDIIYAGTGPFEYMPEATQHILYKSVNGGISWDNVTQSVIKGSDKSSQEAVLPNRYISAIQIDKDNPDDVIVAFAGFGTKHIYRTYDGGLTWNEMDCDGNRCLPDSPVNDLVIGYNSENNMREYFAATDAGVFKSSGENIWHELTEGMPNTVVMDLEIRGDKLRAATFGRGIFEWNLSGTVSQPKRTLTSDKNKQIQVSNYPNPFNPSTEISFELYSAATVKLTIFDITGREIGLLVNGELAPSAYKFKWNGENYSSGIYFYRLDANGISQTKRMLLVK